MSIWLTIASIFVMAGITYLIRMIPFTFFRKKITSPFIKSLLYYLPYAVLSAMTFPSIVFSTGTSNILAGILGMVAALIMAITKRPLILVALVACLTVLIVNYIPVIF